MSYSNPTWYGVGDPMAAQKAFQKSFSEVYSSAESFFTEVDNQVKQDEATLQRQAQQMREQLSTAKRAVPYTKAEINKLVRTFYEENKPSRIDDGGSFLKRVYTTRSSGIDKAKLDEAQSNFKGYSNNINLFTEFALSEKYNDKTTDKGNALYLPLMQAKAAYAKDPSSLKSEYKDGEFKFYVEYGEGKRMDMDELSAGIQGLDPSIRQGIDNEKNAFVKRSAGITKTIIDEQYEVDRAAGTTNVIRGPEVVAAEVEKDLRLKVSSSEEGSNFVQDQFNNNVQIGPKAKAQIFQEVTIGEEKDQVFNGSDLLSSINEIKDPLNRAKALDAFNLILDVPIKDQENIDKLTNIMRDAGANSIYLDNINQGLEEFQLMAVKAQLTQDVLATGVDSKYVAPPRYTTSSRGRGSYRGSGGGSTSKATKVDERAGQAVREAMGIAGINKPFASSSDKPQAFTPGFIRVGKDKKDVSSVKIDANGIAIVGYTFGNPYKAEQKDEDGNTKIVTKQRQKYKKYDTKDPVSMKDMYRDMSESPTVEGFEQQTISKYNNLEGLKDLNRPGMQKWVDWLLKTGPKYYDESKFKDMLITHVAITGLSNDANSIVSWQKFYLKNKDLIDTRRSILRKNQQASTGPNTIGAGTTLSGVTLN